MDFNEYNINFYAECMISTSSLKSTSSVMSDKQLFAMFMQDYVVSKGVNVHKRVLYVH
jgi:hypothetical protein